MATIEVAIAGASGYTGFELIRILARHPLARITTITSRSQQGRHLHHIYPAFHGLFDGIFQDTEPDILTANADVVFTALPHQAAMAIVPELLERGVKVIDLSADFRFRDADVYEKWYQRHTAPQLLESAVYGLPELHRDSIRGASLVGNPGCYPTSIILAAAPLLRHRLIRPDTLIADSKSGVTGAGRGPSLITHFCEVNEGILAYKVGQHRHTPEIEQELSFIAQQPLHLSFTPHLIPMNRGILSTVYASILPGVSPEQISEAFHEDYEGEPFIRLCEPGRLPSTSHVRGTNRCDIAWKFDPRTHRLVVVSVIDNLTRGASGQAVWNMNIMFNLAETLGLDAPSWLP